MKELLKMLSSPRVRLMAVALTLGLIATLLVQAYVRRSIDAISGGELVPIVSAAKSIAAGQAIKETDLTIRRMPSAYVHVRAVDAGNSKLLIGQKASVAIQQGQPVLWTEVSLPNEASLSDLVRVNERAVTIKVDQTSSFSGMIRPADRVDVLTVGRGGGLGGATTLKVLIQGALVIAVDDRTRPAHDELAPGTTAKSRGASTVTLRLSAGDAPRVALADAQGRIVLMLRNRGDIFTTTIPDIGPDEATTTARSSSPLDEKVADYPTVYQEGKPAGSGYYPPPSMATGELQQLSIDDIRRRVLSQSAEAARGGPPAEPEP